MMHREDTFSAKWFPSCDLLVPFPRVNTKIKIKISLNLRSHNKGIWGRLIRLDLRYCLNLEKKSYSVPVLSTRIQNPSLLL